MADETPTTPAKKPRKVLAVPIYVVVDDNTVILPNAKVQVIKKSELPKSGNYYAITSDGLCVQKDTPLVSALTPIKAIDVLADAESHAQLHLPKIPPLIFARAWQFFSKVFDKHHSESEVMLLFNRKTQEYDIWCPNQTVSYASVDYKMSDELAGVDPAWQAVGTIHSHCNFGAYHSGTDVADEADFDGIHITLGHVDRNACSVAVSIAVSKQRWSLPPENVLLGIERKNSTYATKSYGITHSQDDFYTVNLSPEEQQIFEERYEPQIKAEWLPLVKKEAYSWSGGTNWGGNWGGSTNYSVSTQNKFAWTAADADDIDEELGSWRLVDGSWKFVADTKG